MRECPQCHTSAADDEKYCKNCGMQLSEVPVESQETEPVTDMSNDISADSPKKPTKKIPVKIIAAAAVVLIAVVIGALLLHKPGGSGAKDKAAVKDAIEKMTKNFEGRKFEDKLNMAEHPGLITAKQVTGPLLEVRKEDGSFYVPDNTEGEKGGAGKLPTGVKIVKAKDSGIPKAYREGLKKGKKEDPGAYGLMEYTGYGVAGKYNNETFTLYYHTSRVSFYDAETNEMIGWMDTTESRGAPFILYGKDYASDGKHPVKTFDNGTIWSETAWTNALKELFYDEDGYQVVGDRLLSVPDDVNVIEVPKGVKEIDSSVGTSHEAVKLIIPEGVEKIGRSAFSGSKLEEITFPKSLKYCGGDAFSDTPWMKDMEQSSWIIVGDGVLLRCCSQDEELVVPDDVRYIMTGAFGELNCKKITIPATVVQCSGGTGDTNSYAVEYLEALEELVIEGGVKEDIKDISVGVVGLCHNIKKITVSGDIKDLPDGWIGLGDADYQNLTVICPDGSAAARWADEKGVKHQAQ